MKTIGLEELVTLMIEKSRRAFSPERIIGTIKVDLEDDDCAYIYLFYFDFVSFSDSEGIPWDDKLYALIYDSFIEDVELKCLSLRELYDSFNCSINCIYWDTTFDDMHWWVLAYRYLVKLEREKQIMDFYWKLELLYKSTFDAMFHSFCEESGYSSINRFAHEDEMIFHLSERLLRLETELSQYQALVTLPDIELPF